MRAIQLDTINQPVVLRDVPQPVPAAGEVLVRLHAAALNHRDVFIQHGQYAGLRLPCTLGSDGAGTVAAHGPALPADAPALGAAVVINPGWGWGENPRVQGRDFRVLGMPDPGTFAEYLAVPARYLRPRPAHLSWAEAAALPLAGLTAYRAAFVRAQAQAGERVLVTGVGGGVALLAAQLCAAQGCDVWVTSGHAAKLARALALPGIRGGGNYNAPQWEKTLTQQAGGPFDVIIDSAGGAAFGALLDAAAPGGRIVFYGGTLGAIPQLPPAKVFWKQLSILGSTMGSEADFDALLALVVAHQITPVVDEIFPLAAAEAALRRLEASSQFGKVVLEI